ncbi:MAG: c-type cytochrome [Mariprofundus sp.]|nr:c-type cytochrome [Mariprofundus sp.]
MLRISLMAAALFGLNMFAGAAAQATEVKQVFDFYCAQCHGTDGKGGGVNVTKDIATTPRDFTNKVDMAKRTDDDIRTVIKGGGPSISKSALMPPWGKTISDADVELLVTYIRAFAK